MFSLVEIAVGAVAAVAILNAIILVWRRDRRLSIQNKKLTRELETCERGQIDIVAENTALSERVRKLATAEQDLLAVRRELARANVNNDRLCRLEAGLTTENARLAERNAEMMLHSNQKELLENEILVLKQNFTAMTEQCEQLSTLLREQTEVWEHERAVFAAQTAHVKEVEAELASLRAAHAFTSPAPAQQPAIPHEGDVAAASGQYRAA